MTPVTILDPTLAELVFLRAANCRLRTALRSAAAILNADARTMRDPHLDIYPPQHRESVAENNEILADHFRHVADLCQYPRPRKDEAA